MSMQSAPHHYALAHVVFRGMCEADPLRFFAMMASEKRDELLRSVWDHFCKTIKQPPEFDISDVKIETGAIDKFPLLILEMPPPREVTQAHFIGIILQLDPQQPLAEQIPPFRYFTLEKTVSFDEQPAGTVMCEWRENSHSNYGTGPEPTRDAFVKKITEMLQK
jgi:hypothetical protein